MKRKPIDNTTICLFVIAIILLCILFFVYFNIGNENVKWDKFNLENIKDGIFAIMIQQDDGTYKEADNSLWPGDGYKYNSSISGCMDIDGNLIPGALKYNPKTNVAEVNSEYTSYCYLYFDMPATNLYDLCKTYNNIGECIKEESSNLKFISDIWDSELEDDGYRYIGTYPDNYICFGTTDKDTCIDNTDLYMYRIIGIFQDPVGGYHLKLIKKEALNTAYAWHSDYRVDTNWEGSELYNGINGNYFLNNTTYSYMQKDLWLSKIIDWNFIAINTLTNESSGPDYSGVAAQNIYLHEMNRNTKTSTIGEWKNVTSKIGLMYVSDYALSLGERALNYISNSNYGILKTGWMHINHSDETPPNASVNGSGYEWTMSRYGTGTMRNLQYAWYINGSGEIDSTGQYTMHALSVRPVFYLNSSIKISEGKGTQTEPYIIG